MFSQQRHQEQHSIPQPRRKRLNLASLCLLTAMMMAYPLPASALDCIGVCINLDVDIPDNMDHTLELSRQLQQRVDRGIVTLENFNSLIERVPGLAENVNEDIENRIEQIAGILNDTGEAVREVVGEVDRLTTEKIESIELILQDALTRIETLETTFVDDMHTLIDHAACQTAWSTDVFFSRLEGIVSRIRIRVQGEEGIWSFITGGSQIETILEDITNQDLETMLPSRRYQNLKELLLQELQDDTLPANHILSSYDDLQYLSNRFRCYQGVQSLSQNRFNQAIIDYGNRYVLWEYLITLSAERGEPCGTIGECRARARAYRQEVQDNLDTLFTAIAHQEETYHQASQRSIEGLAQELIRVGTLEGDAAEQRAVDILVRAEATATESMPDRTTPQVEHALFTIYDMVWTESMLQLEDECASALECAEQDIMRIQVWDRVYRAGVQESERIQSRDEQVIHTMQEQQVQVLRDRLEEVIDYLIREVGIMLHRFEHEDRVWDVEFSSDGRMLATASYDYTARVYDLTTGQLMHSFEHGKHVNAVEFSSDERMLATVSHDGTARVYDLTTGQQRYSFEHGNQVNAVEFSSDGMMLATASGDNTARVYDLTTGQQLHSFSHGDLVRDVEFASDGRMLGTASYDNTARVYDLTTGQQLHSLHGYFAVEFSSDERMLATAGLDKMARVYDLRTGQQLYSFEHGDYVYDVAFSSDERILATASGDKTARVYDLTTGQQRYSFEHGEWVQDVEFSSDGRMLGTASGDKTARVYDLTTGQQLYSFEHGSYVQDVEFSSDDRMLGTGSHDNTARVYAIRYPDALFPIITSDSE